MTKEYTNMKFSDYIQKQGDEFRRAGDGYEALSNTSKACIDSAVQRFVDEYAAKQQAIEFDIWKRENCINYDYDNKCYSKLIFLDVDHTKVRCESMSIDDTYNQFIEQQNKDNA